MPLYEYKCTKCGHRFEKIESVNASMTKKCPKCGSQAQRTITAPAIQFKGSGWYVTDYAGKSSAKNSGESSEGAAAKGNDKGGDKGSEKSSDKSGDKSSSETKATESKTSTGNEGSKNRKK